ncbi:MAG: YHYH protein, partial [Alphaproteobacteria bacterium]|nr:YHYH protein [Alphaproteobacteria bacterium]
MPKFFLSISVMILTSVAAFAHTIDTDYCDSALYTEEVFNLECTNKHIEFKSKGLPSPDHILMQGITATNQQVPRLHDYDFKIIRKPKPSSTKTKPDSGAIGVAVNGIPLFDSTTQGRVNPATGSRPNTLLEGELDICGGHAGRGDDYHYHIAPVCLIEQLGWFDNANNIEDQLDECRGYTDSKGRYFYNVMTQANWDILTCFTGKPKRFAKDKWAARKD